MDGDGPSGGRKQPMKPLPMIKYKPRLGGPTLYWSPTSKIKRCGCFSDYAYPNEVVLEVDSERNSLANQVQRANSNIEELRKTVKGQCARINKLEKISRRHSAMVGFVRNRTAGISPIVRC